jgi:hypothetical protein
LPQDKFLLRALEKKIMFFSPIKLEKILLAELTLARQSVVFSWNSINGIIECNERQVAELVFLSVQTEISEIKLSYVVVVVGNVSCLEMSVSGAVCHLSVL